jgi:hypothetical protein
MTPTRRNATVRLENDLYEGMQRVWQRDGVLPSEQIRRALREWLESKDGTEKRPAVARKRDEKPKPPPGMNKSTIRRLPLGTAKSTRRE